MRDYVNGATWPNRKLDGYAPVPETGVVPGAGNAYTVELNQRIVRNGTLVIVCGGVTLTAVPYGSVVALGQAGVSYDLPLVQLNSARAGETLSVNYTPGGGVLSSAVFDGKAATAHQHSGADITTGTVADLRLSANVPLKNAANTFAAQQTISGNSLQYGTGGAAGPVAGSAGMKIKLYGGSGAFATSDYAIGIQSGAVWINAGGANSLRLYNNGNEVATFSAAGLILFGTHTIGGGTAISKVLSATASLDFPSIGANLQASLTMTVTGAAVGDSVQVNPSAIEAGLTWSGYVSAVNTVQIRVANSTALAIDPVAATWRATVTKF